VPCRDGIHAWPVKQGDVVKNALRVVEQAIGAPLKPRKIVQFPPRKKNPATVVLGKLGPN